MKSGVITKIQEMGIIPVVVLDSPKEALPLAKALYDGGLPCAEVTFRTAAAKASISIMREAFPDMLIGAGTVLTTAQVDDAIEAGASFIVSPGLNPKVVKHCINRNILIIPGAITPGEVEKAIEFDLEVVKIFPAEAAGGLNMIKAISAPFPNMKFMPTGGINKENVGRYLSFSKVIACGGSWMVSTDLVKAGEFERITQLAKEVVEIVARER